MVNIITNFTVGLEIEVQATYQEGEPAKMPNFSDEVGAPAEPEFIEINKVNSIGFLYKEMDKGWNTAILNLSLELKEEFINAIVNNKYLKDIAEDAIRDEANYE